jgi:hypothetical protein
MHSEQLQQSGQGSQKTGVALPTDGQLHALCIVLTDHPEKFEASAAEEVALFADLIYLLVWSSGYSSLAKALQNPPAEPSPFCLHAALINLVSHVVKFYYDGAVSQPPRPVDQETAHVYSKLQRALVSHINLEQAILTSQLYSQTQQDSGLDFNKCRQPFVKYMEVITAMLGELVGAEAVLEGASAVPQRAIPTKQPQVRKIATRCCAGVEHLSLQNVTSNYLIDYKQAGHSFAALQNYLQEKASVLGLRAQEARTAWYVSTLQSKAELLEQAEKLAALLSQYNQQLQAGKSTRTAERLEKVTQAIAQLNTDEDSSLEVLNKKYQEAVKTYNQVLTESKAKKSSRQSEKRELQQQIQALESFSFPVIESACSTTKAAIAALDKRAQQNAIIDRFNDVRTARIVEHRRRRTPVKKPLQEERVIASESSSSDGGVPVASTITSPRSKNPFSTFFSKVGKGAKKLFAGKKPSQDRAPKPR